MAIPDIKGRLKTQELRDYILQMIESGELCAGACILSEVKLAQACGVSRVTVRRAISGLAQEGILRRVQGKGTFVADSAMAKINTSASRIIFESTTQLPILGSFKFVLGILTSIPNKFNEFSEMMPISRIIARFERETHRHGVGTHFFNISRESPRSLNKKFLDSIKDSKVKGLIYIITDGEPKRVEENIIKLKGLGIPIVVAGYPITSASVDNVVFDNELGGYIATEYLIKLGHTNIVFLTFVENYHWIHSRIKGFKKAMKSYGIPCHKSNVVRIKVNRIDLKNAKMGLLGAEEILKKDNVTAVVCINDDTAKELINALKQFGKRVPNDFSIGGFDDWFAYREYELTTIQFPMEELGEKASTILMDKVTTPSRNEIVEIIKLKPILIIRKTTRKL